MDSRIIYQTPQGGVAVIVPSPNSRLSVEEIAAKDVPTGRPYKIVDVADIPVDRTARNMWTVSFSDLTDGVGAEFGVAV